MTVPWARNIGISDILQVENSGVPAKSGRHKTRSMAKSVKNDPVGARLQSAFGKRMEALRKTTGLNQTDFGARYGRAPNSVSGWENGANWCLPDTMYRICRDFQLTSDFIYYGDIKGLTVERLQWLIEQGIIPKDY